MEPDPGGIHVGIGGWTYAPWRGSFYPPGMRQSGELAYAASRLTSIEINGTFYRTQSPDTFRKWAKAVPPGFRFAVKGHRHVTHRPRLTEADDAIRHFLASGVTELGDRLGPLLWQFPPTTAFEPADFRAFLELLPRELDGVTLRHAVDVRHPSFASRAFVELLRDAGVAVVYTDHPAYPSIADVTAPFVYLRLQRGRDELPEGYSREALSDWVGRLRQWAAGEAPADVPLLGERPQRAPRDVYVYFIHGGKNRAPAAALALIAMLQGGR